MNRTTGSITFDDEGLWLWRVRHDLRSIAEDPDLTPEEKSLFRQAYLACDRDAEVDPTDNEGYLGYEPANPERKVETA